ncbi:MAG: HD domain-containing phosphohydrolase [Desulfovibrio aminophilus]|uniref:HD domain-containing phosphohydrolase n=1 Tax=Desulfovibrio aminophilus TaxID=81425 RepID=UPI0039ED6926
MEQRKKILVVDDEAVNRDVMSGLLRSFGHEPLVADSGLTALEMLREGVDIVLLDAMMPFMDGYELVRVIRADPRHADIPLVMVTALAAKEDRLRAVEAGCTDFISKPIDATELRIRMTSLLRLKSYLDEVKVYQARLEQMVDEQTRALRLAVENLNDTQQAAVRAHRETLHKLAAAAEFKDQNTGQHIVRMSRYSALLASRLGLPPSEVEMVLHGSPMHDIGKIGVPDSVLLKPDKLNAGEWEAMKTHTVIGARILESASSQLLETGRIIAESHHEKWDGSGYPHGLSGEDIPLYGRICAVADVFDALTSRRPYKDAMTNAEALGIMNMGRGKHFDPVIYDLFIKNFDAIVTIQRRFQD